MVIPAFAGQVPGPGGNYANPAVPARTMTATDGTVYGEYISSEGLFWEAVDRRPFAVAPLVDSLTVYYRDGTTGTLTHTGGNIGEGGGYYRNGEGVWMQAAFDAPRFGFCNISTADGYNWTATGVLAEGPATNYARNSAAPASQTTGVLPAGTYTLWVEGAGSCTVSANTAEGTGFGTADAEGYITFVITKTGTVNLKVKGDLTLLQLEGSPFPTSYIPTTRSSASRTADILYGPASLIKDPAGTVALDFTPQFQAEDGVASYIMCTGGKNYLQHQSGAANIRASSDIGFTYVTAAIVNWRREFPKTLVTTWNRSGSRLRVYSATDGVSATATYDGSWDTGGAVYFRAAVSGFYPHGSFRNVRFYDAELKPSEVGGL